MCGNYYLFPDWVEKNKCKEFAEQMKPFAPFSLYDTALKSDEEIKSYLLSVASMRGYFDEVLKKHT